MTTTASHTPAKRTIAVVFGAALADVATSCVRAQWRAQTGASTRREGMRAHPYLATRAISACAAQ